LPHALLQPFDDRFCILNGWNVFQQQHEFVAAVSRHQILVTHAANQPLGEFFQHAVAGGMAMIVVDPLETIEIEKQHCKWRVRTGACPAPIRNSVGNRPAIG
jgi:hypothetical protein